MAAKILAVAGKGGVGKTSISAAMLRLLVEEHPEAKILAVDADPAVGLSTALGVEVTKTLDDIRRSFADGTAKTDPDELAAEARFRLFDAMTETRGYAFLAIGRPEAAGCYCTVKYYGGCDVGSTYTKAVILDEAGGIVSDATIRSKINSEVSATLTMDEVCKAAGLKGPEELLRGVPADCGSCALKSVCDEVEGMREMHFGMRDKGALPPIG